MFSFNLALQTKKYYIYFGLQSFCSTALPITDYEYIAVLADTTRNSIIKLYAMPYNNSRKAVQQSKTFSQRFWERISIFIALSSFLFTYVTNCRQDARENTRWNTLNLAKLNIKNIRFQNYRELTKLELDTTNWGYTVLAVSDPSGFSLNPNRLGLLNCIAAKNIYSKEYIVDPFIVTVPQMIAKLNSQKKYIPSTWQFLKHFFVVYELENIGQTECTVSRQIIKYNDQGTPNKEVTFNIGDGTSLLNYGHTSFSKFELDIPLNLGVLQDFKIEVSYIDIESNIKTVKVAAHYDLNGGFQLQNYN